LLLPKSVAGHRIDVLPSYDYGPPLKRAFFFWLVFSETEAAKPLA
jgi:hypothetical protein